METALKVCANTTATEAFTAGWTLKQSAALEEFSDEELTVARLQKILEVQPEQFDHQVAYLRQERTTTRLTANAKAEQEALGNAIVDGYGYGTPEHQHPNMLLRADGEKMTKDLFQLEEWGLALSEVESLITARAMKDTKTGAQHKTTEPAE